MLDLQYYPNAQEAANNLPVWAQPAAATWLEKQSALDVAEQKRREKLAVRNAEDAARLVEVLEYLGIAVPDGVVVTGYAVDLPGGIRFSLHNYYMSEYGGIVADRNPHQTKVIIEAVLPEGFPDNTIFGGFFYSERDLDRVIDIRENGDCDDYRAWVTQCVLIVAAARKSIIERYEEWLEKRRIEQTNVTPDNSLESSIRQIVLDVLEEQG